MVTNEITGPRAGHVESVVSLRSGVTGGAYARSSTSKHNKLPCRQTTGVPLFSPFQRRNWL
jgi:hypothetical protein